MNNNENQNNYVEPTKVENNQVNSNEVNGFLNRERTNIINATVQANNNINQEQASTVNNAIKVDTNSNRKILISLSLILLVILATAGVLKLVKIAEQKDREIDEANKTTTAAVNQTSVYLNNTKIVRKFRNGNKTLILSPSVSGVDNTYYLIETDGKNIINTEDGTYTIENDVLSMFGSKGEERVLKASTTALVTDGTVYNVDDSEIKCYVGASSYLVLNGSLDSMFAIYQNKEEKRINSFQETQTYIMLNNEIVFNKVGNDLDYNAEILTLKS